ncbi:NAD-dependent epimerase/dehydratase family protein [Paenibacillus protaetiae]|uniref:NAD-dependent epimerase/dehydratase family protein n=1 Tax=Paenibacillus protaetiae TaxID=2509456 RepID=A0A4P6EXL1_9BACL|nr:NAD-dependent epimerase/dehydratase family protein [Paenibacillus protaetiae]QAY67782.1 NAD-dependent epimerase/dehydratase family protein [Paenibacillus protaetiae]
MADQIKKKKILITAQNSYIGNSFADWVKNDDNYSIHFITCRNDEWKNAAFAEFDVILHVAGIAHIKETKHNSALYYKINRDITVELANKAKAEGVKQFVFLSSMSVYGIDSGVIDRDTPVNPKSSYGKSKLQAESFIKKIESKNFKTAILRPPMVYGINCKGNYSRLANLAQNIPLFPCIKNKRSMIYIDHLSEFIKQIIQSEGSGVFYPQNSEYVCTSELAALVCKFKNKKLFQTRIFNPLILILTKKINAINKLFGNLMYSTSLSNIGFKYNLFTFEETVEQIERKK